MTKHVLSLEEDYFRKRIIAAKPGNATGYCLYLPTGTGHPGPRITAESGEPLCLQDDSFEFPSNCKPGTYYVQFYLYRRPIGAAETMLHWPGERSRGEPAGNPNVREAAHQELRAARLLEQQPPIHPSVLEHPDYLSAQLDHSVSSLAYSERQLLSRDTRQAIHTQELAEVHALASHQRRELANQITTGTAQLERCLASMQQMAEQQFVNLARMNTTYESMLAGVAVMADKIPELAMKLTTPAAPGSSARAWGEAIAGILQQCAPMLQDVFGNRSAQSAPRQSGSKEELLALLAKLGVTDELIKKSGHDTATGGSPPTKVVDSKPSVEAK